MLHIHHVNLQTVVGGGEIYTLALTRALSDAGATVTLYAHPANRLWDGLGGVQRVADEAQLLARLPAKAALVVTQSPISGGTLDVLARNHRLVGFAHMPMLGRGAEDFRRCRLVVTVSHYCIGLLRRANIEQVYAEPMYGIAGRMGAGSGAVAARSPYAWDRRKFRDRLLGALEPACAVFGSKRIFQKAPGLTLGIVSLLSPIKQLPQLFTILAPILARSAQPRLEVFGNGGFAQVRDLKRALAPLGDRVRFWGYQENVGAIYSQLDYLMTGLPEKEALGLNVLEAQSCGTPVLAPDAPPFTETMIDGASGYLYRDPRQDGGEHFAKILAAILAGRPRPDPRIAARQHLQRFAYPALVERARGLIAALSDLE